MLYGLWRVGLAGASEADTSLSEGAVVVVSSEGPVAAGGGTFAMARGGATGPESLSIESEEAGELAMVDAFTLTAGFTDAGFVDATPSDDGSGAFAKSGGGCGSG